MRTAMWLQWSTSAFARPVVTSCSHMNKSNLTDLQMSLAPASKQKRIYRITIAISNACQTIVLANKYLMADAVKALSAA